MAAPPAAPLSIEATTGVRNRDSADSATKVTTVNTV